MNELSPVSTSSAEATADRAAKHTIHLHVSADLLAWLEKIRKEGDFPSRAGLIVSMLEMIQRDCEAAEQ